jgi:hypothetical protein
MGSQTVTTVKSGSTESVVVVVELGVKVRVGVVTGTIDMMSVLSVVSRSLTELEEELGVAGNGITETVVIGTMVRSDVVSGKIEKVGEEGKPGMMVGPESSVLVPSTLERMKTVPALVVSLNDAVAAAGVASSVSVVDADSVAKVPKLSEMIEVRRPDTSVPESAEVKVSETASVMVVNAMVSVVTSGSSVTVTV